VIGGDGRYVDANAALLATTGYTLEELRQLIVGQLSTTSPEVARQLWDAVRRGEFELHSRPVPVLVRRKDGRLFDAIFVGATASEDRSRWTVHLELVRLPEERPAREALQVTLSDWRAAERHLTSLAASDPLRSVVEAQVADLRDRYRELNESMRSATGQEPPALSTT
jgi:PAS domain S-box-containing protein